MAVYASKPGFADRRAHPRALLLIVGAHAALLAAVMSAKMDLPAKIIPTITKIELIDPPKPPPPPEPSPPQPSQPKQSRIDQLPAIVPVPPRDVPSIDPTPMPLPLPTPGPIGPSLDPAPLPQPLPAPDPVRVGPRFATPESLLKPPYPLEKLRTEEEASLKLRLSIDERGRVVAVEPVGRADSSFLEAARRHLIAKWRYKPATEDGRPVASSTVITLTFQIEG